MGSTRLGEACLDDAPRVRTEGLGLVRAIAGKRGQLLGAIDLKGVDWAAKVAEIGYWTHPSSPRSGVMTRAVSLLARWTLADQQFERIELRVAPANLASVRVAEKAGFVREGIARSAGYVHDGRVDLVVFSLIRERPQSLTSTTARRANRCCTSGHARVP